MMRRILFGLTCSVALCLGQSGSIAQSGGQAPREDWAHDYVVLTVYGDAWGAGADAIFDRAIARALANCQAMSGQVLGCGGYFTSVRAGWSLGLRCGDRTIVVAERDLSEAERNASLREEELRTLYVSDLPACVRVATIDPAGRSITPEEARQFSGARGRR